MTKTENSFERSSFKTEHRPKIVDRAQNGRRKQKKLKNSFNKKDINDDASENLRDVGNFVENETNGNSNNMKDYNKYSLFNTAPTCSCQLSLILFLTYHVIKI